METNNAADDLQGVWVYKRELFHAVVMVANCHTPGRVTSSPLLQAASLNLL